MTFDLHRGMRSGSRQRSGPETNRRALLSCESGASPVEYVLIIAILVGATLAMTRVVSHSASDNQTAQSPTASSEVVIGDNDGKPVYGHLDQPPTQANMFSTIRLLAEIATISLIAVLLLFGVHTRRETKRMEGALFSGGDQASFKAARKRLFAKRQAILQAVTADSAALFNSQLTVRHLMTSTITRVYPETTAKKVVSLMHNERLRHLMVCDASENLLGVISDRDLKKKGAKTAADIMTDSPITAAPDDLIGPTITGMMNRRISALPVVEHGKLSGILTTTDLMMTLQCCLQVLQAAASDTESAAAEANSEASTESTDDDWSKQTVEFQQV